MELSSSMWIAPAETVRASAQQRVAAVGGDGIGPEVVAAGARCLSVVAPDLEIVAREPPATGDPFPAELRSELERADAVLFGAVDTEAGRAKPILRFLRFVRNAYANLRPVSTLPGVPATIGAAGTNLVIVRELTEGMYPAREGNLADLAAALPAFRDPLGRPLPAEGMFAVRVVTRPASARIGAYAARLAAWRRDRGFGRGRITIVTKQNVLAKSDGLFRSTCEEQIAAVGGLEVDHLYVDEAARRLVAMPESFDVILTTNLFGDILSDVAGEAMGGLPLAPSAGVGEGWAYFESCHGSAPDLAGKDVANPTATIFSAAMLLTYLGRQEAADRLLRATLEVLGAGVRTRDMGGKTGTTEFTDQVCRRLAG